jgi:hypothetical protein
MPEEANTAGEEGIREIDLLLQSSLDLLEVLSAAGDILSEDDELREECLAVVALLAESAILSQQSGSEAAIVDLLLQHCAALASATLNPATSGFALAMISPDS